MRVFTVYVASQIRGTSSWNQKQLMASESHDSVLLNCDATSLMLLSKKTFLCLHLETNSVRLFNGVSRVAVPVTKKIDNSYR